MRLRRKVEYALNSEKLRTLEVENEGLKSLVQAQNEYLEQFRDVVTQLTQRLNEATPIVAAAGELQRLISFFAANQGQPVRFEVDMTIPGAELYRHALIERIRELRLAIEEGKAPEYSIKCTDHLGQPAEWFMATAADTIN